MGKHDTEQPRSIALNILTRHGLDDEFDSDAILDALQEAVQDGIDLGKRQVDRSYASIARSAAHRG